MICKVRKKEVKETPEEIVRQEYIDVLTGEYGYQIEDIHLEYPVKKSPSDKKSYPVDICIKENGKEKVFIETKKADEKPNLGIIQLQNYMSLNENVKWGIWTNGSDTLYIKKMVKNNKIDYVEVYNIPLVNFNDVSEQIKINELKRSDNLKVLFKTMRAYVAAHSVGTTRDEVIARELVKIVLCKTYDEKFKAEDDYVDFYYKINNDEETAKQIKKIYIEVKQKYDEVFEDTDEILLDNKSISYIVSQLQHISLTKSSRNVISEAFETIIGYSLKGSSGQFFTPKNVVNLLVKIAKPGKREKIIDPAAGSGGFLIESMLYNWEKINEYKMNQIAIVEEQKDYAMKNIFGIEKDDFLAQITKAYMAVLGDGKAGLCIEDSLEYPENWENNLIKLGMFDLVLTNPPFGKNIKLDDKIKKQYMADKVDIAFLERSIDLLRDGGKLVIVLSEVIFHAPSYKDIREKLFYTHNITHIIDLPHDTFKPFNNAKCIAIILEKKQKQQQKIMLINLKEIGHTHTGETKYVYDYENKVQTKELADDVPKVLDLLENNNVDNDLVKQVDSNKILNSDILVPRFYFKNELKNFKNVVSIEQLISEGVIITFQGYGSPTAHFKGKGNVPYIRVKDIGNLEININKMDSIPEYVAKELKSNKMLVQENDIVMVWRGSYRIGDVGIIYKKDINSVYTKELQFFRVNPENKYGLTNNNLLYFLNSDITKNQIKDMIFIDTTLPTLYNRWKNIKIPVLSKSEMINLDNKISNMVEHRKSYWEVYKKL